jgi:DNA-binding XRE family transcriptional regulator
MYINENELECVVNYQHFKEKYYKIVDKTQQIRKEIPLTQQELAQDMGVLRWKIIDFENKKNMDLELMFLICEKLGIDLYFKYEII